MKSIVLLLLLSVSLVSSNDDVTLKGAFRIVDGAPRHQIPKSIGSDEAGFESEAMKTAHRFLQKRLRQERANYGLE